MAKSNPNIPTVNIVLQDPVTGYVVQGIVEGTPPSGAAYAGIFSLECLLTDTNGAGLYEQTGTVAVPAWTLLGAGALGITQLTGDVTAGPGSGSQAATIANLAVTNAKVAAAAAIDFSKLAALTSGNILVGSAGNVAVSVAMSGNATISNAGVVTVNGATGAFTAGGAITNAGGTLAVGFIPTLASDARVGPGAVAIATYQTRLTTTGTGDALTLASAARIGQLKKISYIAEGAGGDTGVLTPVAGTGFTTATFNAIGDYAVFMWDGAGWLPIDYVGVTLA